MEVLTDRVEQLRGRRRVHVYLIVEELLRAIDAERVHLLRLSMERIALNNGIFRNCPFQSFSESDFDEKLTAQQLTLAFCFSTKG